MPTTWNLRITDRRGRAKVHTMGNLPLILGRDETLPIPLDDPQASRRHCKIEAADGNSFRVEDMGSTNGTLINGRKIPRGVVTDGDRVKLGETIIEFIKVEEVAVEDDTGMRRLSVLKSFSSPSKKPVADVKSEEKSAVLSRIGLPGASGGVATPASNQRLTLVADIAHLLTEQREELETLKSILEGLLQVYPIDRVAVLKRDEEKNTLDPTISRSKEGAAGGVVVSRTICQHVLKTGEAIVTESAITDPRFSSGDSIIEHRVGSVVAAPINARGVMLGVLYACTNEKAAHFNDTDLSFLALVGNLIALAMLLERKPA